MKKTNLVLKILAALLIMTITVMTAGCRSTEAETTVTNVSAQEAYSLIQDNQDNSGFVVLDVRTPDEFGSGHLAGALNLDVNSSAFRTEADKLYKKDTYLVYCRSGGRSSTAVSIMKELKFTRIYHMTGGITEWNSEGLPTIR